MGKFTDWLHGEEKQVIDDVNTDVMADFAPQLAQIQQTITSVQQTVEAVEAKILGLVDDVTAIPDGIKTVVDEIVGGASSTIETVVKDTAVSANDIAGAVIGSLKNLPIIGPMLLDAETQKRGPDGGHL